MKIYGEPESRISYICFQFNVMNWEFCEGRLQMPWKINAVSEQSHHAAKWAASSSFLVPLALFSPMFYRMWGQSPSPHEGAQPRAPQDTPLAMWCRFGTDTLTPTSCSSSTLLRQLQECWGSTCTLLCVFETPPAHTSFPFSAFEVIWAKKTHCGAPLGCAAALPGSAALTPRAEPGTSSYTKHLPRAAELHQAHQETAPFGVPGVSFWINHLSVHRSRLPGRTRLFTASQPCGSNGSQKKWETSWKYTEHWQVLMGLLSCFKAILLTHYAATEGNYFQGKWLHDPGWALIMAIKLTCD